MKTCFSLLVISGFSIFKVTFTYGTSMQISIYSILLYAWFELAFQSIVMNSTLILLAFQIALVWKGLLYFNRIPYMVLMYTSKLHMLWYSRHILLIMEIIFISKVEFTWQQLLGLNRASDQHVTEFLCSVGVDRILLTSNLQWKCLINVHSHRTLLTGDHLNIPIGHWCQRWKISSHFH